MFPTIVCGTTSGLYPVDYTKRLNGVSIGQSLPYSCCPVLNRNLGNEVGRSLTQTFINRSIRLDLRLDSKVSTSRTRKTLTTINRNQVGMKETVRPVEKLLTELISMSNTVRCHKRETHFGNVDRTLV